MARRSEAELRVLEEMAQDIARMLGKIIDKAISGSPVDQSPEEKPLFTLFLFTPGDKGWLTYTSSAEREGIIESLEKFLPLLKAGKERAPLRDMH